MTPGDYKQFEEELEELIRRAILGMHVKQEGLQRLGVDGRPWRLAFQEVDRQVQAGELTLDDREVLVTDLEALLESVKGRQFELPQYNTSLASIHGQ
ncbi:hypothetical protein [Streptomyces sp. UG1]|uniref:hypothetical protein n=1 Tax=Streptomyces sp. UG1 TaxID=3417652 RepID=UPI003CF83E1C